MVSICFKSLEKKTIVNFESLLDYSNFENVIYSKRKFKNYYNLIVHYTGKNKDNFFDFISNLFCEYIMNNYENKYIMMQLRSDFFYFTSSEQKEILNLTTNSLSQEAKKAEKKLILSNLIFSYIINNKRIIIDGFINFRIFDYKKYLNDEIEKNVHEYVIHKEYLEYINLLKNYIGEKNSQTNLIHLVFSDTEKTLLDDNLNVITTTFDKKYLSDISFSENDFILNSILSLMPRNIIIHSNNNSDEFLQFIKNIFEDRCTFCCGCKFCINNFNKEHLIP